MWPPLTTWEQRGGLTAAGPWSESFLLSRPPWHHPVEKRRGDLILPGRGGGPGSPYSPCWQPSGGGRWGVSSPPVRMTVPAPSFAFCDITLMRVRGVGVPCCSLVRVKVQAPYSAFTVVHVAGATVFSVLHGWRRAVGVSVVFCFVVFAPFLVLWLKERAFSLVTGLLVFFNLCLLALLDFWFLYIHVWYIRSKTKIQGTHHPVISWALRLPSWFASSPTFRVLVCLFDVYYPGFWIVFSERNRDQYFSSIFTKSNPHFLRQV